MLPSAPPRVVPSPAGLASGGMQHRYEPAPAPERPWSRRHLTTNGKFVVATTGALAWVGLSVWVSLPWIHQAAHPLQLGPAIAVVVLLAFLPGLLVAFLAISLLLDRQPPLSALHPTTPLTVLVAARNEAGRIGVTLRYLAAQDYDRPLAVVLVDNGSDDGTAAVARAAAAEAGLELHVIAPQPRRPRRLRGAVPDDHVDGVGRRLRPAAARPASPLEVAPGRRGADRPAGARRSRAGRGDSRPSPLRSPTSHRDAVRGFHEPIGA